MAVFTTCLTVPVQKAVQRWWGLEGEAGQDAGGQLWGQGGHRLFLQLLLENKTCENPVTH